MTSGERDESAVNVGKEDSISWRRVLSGWEGVRCSWRVILEMMVGVILVWSSVGNALPSTITVGAVWRDRGQYVVVDDGKESSSPDLWWICISLSHDIGPQRRYGVSCALVEGVHSAIDGVPASCLDALQSVKQVL